MSGLQEQDVIVQLNGPHPGGTINLDPKRTTYSIGRDAQRDIPLEDHLASRLHAQLSYDGQGWRLEDCGSRNGTLVNMQPIDQILLAPGDLIRIGSRLFVFLSASCQDAGDLSPAAYTDSTKVVRLGAGERRGRWAWSEDLQQDVQRLSALCKLAMEVQAARTVEQLVAATSDLLLESTPTGEVKVWLVGTDGRLRQLAQDSRPGNDDSRLLANLAVESRDGILVDGRAQEHWTTDASCETTVAEISRADTGTVLVAPIPGHPRMRGVIQCVALAGAQLSRRDLELCIAIAHQFGLALENIEHREKIEQANADLRAQVGQQHHLVGESDCMQQLRSRIHRVAPTDTTVLILGETGTGKELVARTIHELSRRGSGPFIAVNCAAINQSLQESELFGHEAGAFTGADRRRAGQFERAHRGTIFLDEVGEMSLDCQAKLLRVLEGQRFERVGGTETVEVDVRIVAATNRNLREMVSQRTFREDLYFRLNVIEVTTPPLRQRGDDVLRLAEHYLVQYTHEIGCGAKSFSADAIEALRRHRWPGNVRELRNVVERAVVFCETDQIRSEDFAFPVADSEAASEGQLVSLAEMEQRHIERVMEAVRGNKTDACRVLGISRATLYKKLS